MSLSQPIDPKRPWVTDPDDVPGEGRIWKSLFWPAGVSSKVSFTRAWTVCFMSRIFIIVFPAALAFLAGLAGMSAGPIQAVQLSLIPIVFVVTVLLSVIVHIRRLSDAGKSTILASIVTLPMVLGGAMFVFVASQTVPKANKIQERIEWAKANPELARQQQEEERAAARNAQGEGKPGDSARQRGRGNRAGRGGPGGREFSAAGMVIGAAMMPAILVWAITSFLVMLWSLMWVARLPRANQVDLSGMGRPVRS